MQEERSLFSFLARHKKSVLTFLIFIAYAGAVFWSNYQSLQSAQENALLQFRMESEKQAYALSYFFSERRSDAVELAESEPVVNFFRNRDLGMSYQYGLGVNIQLIEDRFEYVFNRKRSGGMPVFTGFMLVDHNGAAVAEWQAPGGETVPSAWLLPGNHEPRVRLGARHGTLAIMAPVWINGAYRGELLAWLDADSSFAQFGPARSNRYGLLVDRQTGEPLRDRNDGPRFGPQDWQAISALSARDNKARVFAQASDGRHYHVARFDIEQTPIAFVSIAPARAAENGTARLFVIAAAVVPFIVVLVGFLDVLERRRLENLRILAQTEAERLAQARSDFLANMSHEIRTPMNAIIGMTELCLASQPSRKQRSYLTKIQQTSDLLLRIINDILNFSKIESGKLEIERTPFDLDRTLGDVGNLLSGDAAKKDIEIVFDVDASCNRIFIGDSLRLEQVLINLVGNAVKFSERGNITIRVRCEESAPDSAQLHVDITDEGIGISEEQQARLFNAFTQADATTTRRFGGSGLGLAISKRLVELMGGGIRVRSAPGQGSTFSFSVRLGVDPKQPSRFIALKKKLALFAARPVLVIDDNPAYRQAIAAQLAQIGLSCMACASGDEAIAAVARHDREDHLSILVDQRMPGKSGLETIRGLRNAWRIGSVPPIFLLTTYAQDIDHEADAAMFDGILTKPTTANQLYAEIAPFLGIRVDPVLLPHGAPGALPDSLRGLDVLLVDDVPFNQEIVRDMLEDAGLSVRIAGNGVDTLAAVAARRPDCILMDCQMPIMDGYEATRRLRLDERHRDLPIIALTANALASEREKCRAAGMDGYIVKPVRSADLLAALARHARPRAGHGGAPIAPVLVPAPPPLDEAALPELPGIDVATGLRYADGQLVNYRKILRLFHETHGRNFTLDVHDALARENWKDAARHAHSFKSAARIIGAAQLGDLSSALESACDAQQPETARQLLERLADELRVVCAGLAPLLQGD